MHQGPNYNSNNLYSVQRIHDDNVNAGNFSTTPSGLKYYTLLITPNDYSQLVCSGNFTIDGLSSSWVYNSDYHPTGSGNACYPVNPPWHGSSVGQSVRHSTPHSYILKGGAGPNVCWGPNSNSGQNFIGNGTYRFNGPFEFDNSAYCDGAFTSSTDSVTWRKIILMDIYENDQGNLINDLYDPATYSENLETWLQYMPDPNNPNFVPLEPTHNGYPKHIKVFVFPEYHDENPLQATMEIDLDIDYVTPVQGCTDSGANNYDSLASTNDGSCTYPPPPLAFPPITVSSDITSANHTLYSAMQFNGGYTNPNALTVLVLENIVFDIPMPTNGTPPYSEYSIELLNDTVTVSGSPTGSGSIPSEIIQINTFASTINPTDPLLYDDMHLMDFTAQLPPGPNFPVELDQVGVEPGDGVSTFNAGSFYINKVILSVPGTPSSSYSVQNITLQVSAEDANGDVVNSSVSVDIAAELGI